MAPALECPACGARHRLDGREPDSVFRCVRCGQKLLVPAAAGAGAPPPPRRSGVPGAPRPSSAGVVTVTVPASGSSPAGPKQGPPTAVAPPPAPRARAKWYWRLLAWVVAVPLGFVITVWPSYELGIISKDDLLDVFVGTGADRYLRLGAVTAIWAVVTALLVQLFVEGGRMWAAHRRARRDRRRTGSGPAPVPSA
jgi:hypothetical protein